MKSISPKNWKINDVLLFLKNKLFLKTRLNRQASPRLRRGIHGGISCGISGFSVALMLTLNFYANDLHRQTRDLKKRLLSVRHLTIRSQEATDLLASYPDDYAAFEACRLEAPIDPETLQNSFLHALEFGPVSSCEKESKSGLIRQEISFSISCLRDKDVFILLEQLIRQGPGLFQIREATLKRLRPLSAEMLAKIAAGNPQHLFNGKIAATWIHR